MRKDDPHRAKEAWWDAYTAEKVAEDRYLAIKKREAKAYDVWLKAREKQQEAWAAFQEAELVASSAPGSLAPALGANRSRPD